MVIQSLQEQIEATTRLQIFYRIEVYSNEIAKTNWRTISVICRQ